MESEEKIAGEKCGVCGGPGEIVEEGLFDTRFRVGGTYSVMRCSDCGTQQTIPRPVERDLKWLYADYYNFGGSGSSIYTWLREKFHFALPYNPWALIDGDVSFHLPRGEGRLLDLGCNEGRNLRIYKKNGFDAEGLEMNEKAAEKARSLGLTVHTEPLEAFDPPRKYDVVVLSNVLEHSVKPQEMLKAVSRILKSQGEVWISLPNAESWLKHVFGRFWINWHVPFHLYHFSTSTLANLLKSNGFEVVKISQKTPALWVAQSIIAFFFAAPRRRTRQLRNPFIVAPLMFLVRGLLFPVLIFGDAVGHGDALVVRARKP